MDPLFSHRHCRSMNCVHILFPVLSSASYVCVIAPTLMNLMDPYVQQSVSFPTPAIRNVDLVTCCKPTRQVHPFSARCQVAARALRKHLVVSRTIEMLVVRLLAYRAFINLTVDVWSPVKRVLYLSKRFMYCSYVCNVTGYQLSRL
jgi:hypothetical protein